MRKGNALLIAILLTTVLTLLTVNLSQLITSDTRQIGLLINGGKAEYLGEGGSEIALYTIHQSKPGFEPTEINNTPLTFSFEEDSDKPKEQFSYSIDATASSLPIVEDYVKDLIKTGQLTKKELFADLQINESITIPIQDSAQKFEVEYYLPIETEGIRLPDWDILLWKIFGKDNANNTNSLSEYFPASGPTSLGDAASTIGTSAENPARMGTDRGFNQANYFAFSSDELEDVNIFEEQKVIQISTFFETHKEKFLILKNALNPSQINLGRLGASVSLNEAAVIKYRVCTPNCDSPNEDDTGLVPEFTRIESSGKFGDIEKRLNTSVNREGFLPVFDFSIYRTTSSSSL